MQLRTLQTIDGLGPTASNTVVLAVPVEVLESSTCSTAYRSGGIPDSVAFTIGVSSVLTDFIRSLAETSRSMNRAAR